MTPERIKSYLKYVKDADLKWDRMEQAEKLADDPKAFELFFRRYHGPLICQLIFDGDMRKTPLLMTSKVGWVGTTARWLLENGNC